MSTLGGHLLQTWDWGEFKSRHGWRPRRLLIARDGRPLAAAQILFRSRGPFSVAYVPRGPVVAGADRSVLAALTLGIDREARRERAILALIEPEQAGPDWRSLGRLAWRDSPMLVQPRRTIKLAVDASDEQLLASMKPKTRYNVRLAERRGVTVRFGARSDLPEFYALLDETARRDRFGIHAPAYFDDLFQTFEGHVALVLAEYEGQLAAGAIVVRAFDEAIYLYGASKSELQRHMAAYLVQFEAMRWARTAGCRTYDLWGIPEDDEPPETTDERQSSLNVRSGLWGVYRFKQGFGGEVVCYPRIVERVYSGALVRLARLIGVGLA